MDRHPVAVLPLPLTTTNAKDDSVVDQREEDSEKNNLAEHTGEVLNPDEDTSLGDTAIPVYMEETPLESDNNPVFHGGKERTLVGAIRTADDSVVDQSEEDSEKSYLAEHTGEVLNSDKDTSLEDSAIPINVKERPMESDDNPVSHRGKGRTSGGAVGVEAFCQAVKSIYFIILSLPLIRIFAPIIENIVNTTLVLIPVDSSSMNKTLSPLNDAIVDKEEDALKILAALRNKFMKHAGWMQQKMEGLAESTKSLFSFTFGSSFMNSILPYFQSKVSESADMMFGVFDRGASALRALKSKAVETFTAVKTKIGEICDGTLNTAGDIYGLISKNRNE